MLNGKYQGETRAEVFDFASRLSLGETISSASTVATTYSGTDASPSGIISGSASISGSKVTQVVTAGTLGVTYLLVCTANTSAGQVLQIAAFLPVVPDQS
jgi:hypothetical protein